MHTQLSPGRGVSSETLSSSLLANKLLNRLSTQLYQSVRAGLEPISIKKGTVLYYSNDRVDYVYFPETAVFSERLIESASENRMIEIGLIGNNGAAGLVQVLIGTSSANYTVAIKSGSAMKMEVYKFLQLVAKHPELRKITDHYFTSFSHSLCQRPACFLFHSSRQRFCTWLVGYFRKSGISTLRATHSEIAQCLGIYRPNVTLLTHELKKEKLIACSRGSLTVLDSARLQMSACGCY